MLDPNRREDSRQESADISGGELARKALDEPSIFVASIVDLLVKRKSEDSLRAAELLRHTGVLTGREFNRIVESLSDEATQAQLLWAYSFITKQVVDVDFAQGFGGLVTLAHGCLTSRSAPDDASQRRLHIVLDRLLDARVGSDDVSDAVTAASSLKERAKLQEIATQGFQDRKGYWDSLELLCGVYPDTSSLESLFRAVDRLGSRAYSREERTGITRCVAAVAAGDMPGAFQFIAQALGESDSVEGEALRVAIAAGLAYHAETSTSALCSFLASSEPAEVMLACRVCVMADRDPEVDLTKVGREALTEELHVILGSRPDHSRYEPKLDAALAALARVSTDIHDIEHVGDVVRQRLADKETVSSVLISAYANGLARIYGNHGIRGFKPLSDRRVASLCANPPLTHTAAGLRRIVASVDTDSAFENLALDISRAADLDEVLALCRQHQHLLDSRFLRTRPNDSSSIFHELLDAARFSHFYSELAERGPVEFAAALLPELLSSVERGRGSPREVFRDFIGENGIRSLASLTSVIANNPRLREISVSRMCAADWELLAGFHKEGEADYPRAYPNLGLAVFALRSAVEDEKGWQRELVSWWRKVRDHERELMDKNALAFVSVAAERCSPGAAIELLGKISLSKDDDATFRDIASGLLIHREASIVKAMDLAGSRRAQDLARGLLLAQLMVRQLNNAQKDYFASVARRSIDEMGILALDAVCAVGALSDSRDDALLLLRSEPALGLDEKTYRVTSAYAAAHVIRNFERRRN